MANTQPGRTHHARAKKLTGELKATQDRLYAEVSRRGKVLAQFPKGPMGLTPDAVKDTHEWQIAKRERDAAFAELQAFNKRHVLHGKAGVL